MESLKNGKGAIYKQMIKGECSKPTTKV